MHKRGNLEYLYDMENALNSISDYVKKSSYKKFIKDKKSQDAVIYNIGILGEAVKNISNDLRKAEPDVAWKNIAGMRDKIIHFYFGVNIDIVWDVAKKKAPPDFRNAAPNYLQMIL
ncbi:MAG: hypothetical protein CVU78_03240 [Elusimicrobia bacterium HGW-Elusimicrobia-2]|nr:MAG: hypothetical protein CVU78_03240 [Elusimicrobia bacterium HGW-Elusimicrobia-2]